MAIILTSATPELLAATAASPTDSDLLRELVELRREVEQLREFVADITGDLDAGVLTVAQA